MYVCMCVCVCVTLTDMSLSLMIKRRSATRWTVADALQLTTGHDRGFYCVFFTFWGNNYNGQKSISIGS